MDYFVPNFGRSEEIMDVNASLHASQQANGHQWNWKLVKPGKFPQPTQYNFAPELDDDMKSTANHLGYAENTLGRPMEFEDIAVTQELMRQHHRHLRHIQSLAQSDPISGSAGWPEKKGKKKAPLDVEYPDPDSMELDPDVVDTAANLKSTEKSMGRTWKWDDSEEYGAKWMNKYDTWSRAASAPAEEAIGAAAGVPAEVAGQAAMQMSAPNNTPWARGDDAEQQHVTQNMHIAQKSDNTPWARGPSADQQHETQNKHIAQVSDVAPTVDHEPADQTHPTQNTHVQAHPHVDHTPADQHHSTQETTSHAQVSGHHHKHHKKHAKTACPFAKK